MKHTLAHIVIIQAQNDPRVAGAAILVTVVPEGAAHNARADKVIGKRDKVWLIRRCHHLKNELEYDRSGQRQRTEQLGLNRE